MSGSMNVEEAGHLRGDEGGPATLAELLRKTPWETVQAALLGARDKKLAILAYRMLTAHLLQLEPRPSSMRICVEPERIPCNTMDPELVVVGRNGSRNRDSPDWRECMAPPEHDDEEAIYSLSFKPWEEWLGMLVDPPTLRSMPLGDVLARVLMDMTFYGFTQERIAQVRENLVASRDAFDALSPEQRESSFRSVEEVFASIKSRLDRQ